MPGRMYLAAITAIVANGFTEGTSHGSRLERCCGHHRSLGSIKVVVVSGNPLTELIGNMKDLPAILRWY